MSDPESLDAVLEEIRRSEKAFLSELSSPDYDHRRAAELWNSHVRMRTRARNIEGEMGDKMYLCASCGTVVGIGVAICPKCGDVEILEEDLQEAYDSDSEEASST